MKKIEIDKLYDTDYTVKIINALTQRWSKVKSFNSLGTPKRYDMLLFLDNCDAVYTLKSGEKIYAKKVL